MNDTRIMIAAAAIQILLGGCSSSPPATKSDPCDVCAADTYCCEKTEQCEPIQRTCGADFRCDPGYEFVYGAGPYMDTRTCEALPSECSCKPAPALAPGFVGFHASLLATDTELLASAYDRTYGDLTLIRAPLAALSAPTFEVVDGAPDAPITHDPTGYRRGVKAAGEDVGRGSSLVHATDGTISIAYYANGSGELRFAQLDPQGAGWTRHTIDSPSDESTERIGQHLSLALVAQRPSLLYTADRLRQPDGTMRSELRWAWAKSAVPGAAHEWAIAVVDSSVMPCSDTCASGEACVGAAGSAGACTTTTSDCTDPCEEGTVCVATQCQPSLDGANAGLSRAIGQWPLQFSAADKLVAAYYDGNAGRLRLATNSPLGAQQTWSIVTAAEFPGERVGAYLCGFGDQSSYHFAFQNETSSALHYLRLSATTFEAEVDEIIDDGARSDGQHIVGADCALAADGSGALRVLYQDQTSVDLLSAARAPNGGWEPNDSQQAGLGRTLKGGAPGYGFYSRLALAEGQLYGISSFIDPTTPLGGGFELLVVP